MGIEERFNKGAGSAFTFGAGNADDSARAMVEEVFGDRGFVGQMKWWHGGATKNVIVT